jgi:hypothetical protein
MMPYGKPKVSGMARRMFRPVVLADGPVKLDLSRVRDTRLARAAIADMGDLVRACEDDPDPLRCSYVLTSGSAGHFYSTWDRLWLWVKTSLFFLRG